MKKFGIVLVLTMFTGCTSNLINVLNPLNIFNKHYQTENLSAERFPYVINHHVYRFINYYLNNGKIHLLYVINKSKKYIYFIKKTFKEEGIPEDLAYLPIIESGFNIAAYSRKKAGGLWQFIPGTARIYGLKLNWWFDERRDVEKATRAAAKHLKVLYRYYKDWYLVLAAYNAGGGKIRRAMRKYKTKNFWEISGKRWGILKKETRNYVPKMVALSVMLNNPDKFGINLPVPEIPPSYDLVMIPDATDLKVIAECCNSTFKEIKELNPELKQWATPPFYKDYKLRIPAGTKGIFLNNFNSIPQEERITYRRHKIKQGETISGIALKYRTDKKSIYKLNKIKDPRKIISGKYLIIPIRGVPKEKKDLSKAKNIMSN